MFVIVRISDGYFVTPPGSERSYTPFLQAARIFATREKAEKERCSGNEQVAPVTDYLQPPEH
jgi:hypothetical protein